MNTVAIQKVNHNYQCVFTGSYVDINCHHVIPLTAWKSLTKVLSPICLRPIYWKIYLIKKIHDEIEYELNDVYKNELTSITGSCSHSSLYHYKRTLLYLNTLLITNKINEYPQIDLHFALKRLNVSSIQDIPIVDLNSLKQEIKFLKESEKRNLIQTKRNYWYNKWETLGSKEFFKLFVSPILYRNPQFLSPHIVTFWNKLII